MNTKELKIGLAGVIALLLCRLIDAPVSRIFQSIRFEPLSSIMIFLSKDAFLVAVVLIISAIALFNKQLRKEGFAFWLILSTAAAVLVGRMLKDVIGRPRPQSIGITPLTAETNASMPSTHAAGIFAASEMLSSVYKNINWLLFGFAVLVSISRLYLGVHYLSDIIVGGYLGRYVSLLMLYLQSKVNKRK